MQQIIFHQFMSQSLIIAIPSRIKELRNEKTLTQQYMANELGLAQNTYAQYESGKRRIPLELIPKIASILNISEERILIGEQEETPSKRGRVSELEKRIMELKKLPKRDQKLAVDMLDRIIKTAT